jgi:tight adherence protein C
MLLLIVAASCIAASCFAVTQVVTLPERERRSLVRRAARYGAVRSQLSLEKVSLRERVLLPAAGRIAGLMLRFDRTQTLEQVQQRLLAAGVRNVTPSSFLAAKGALAGTGAVVGLIFWVASRGGLTGFLLVLALGAGGFVAPGYVLGARARKRRDRVESLLPDALDLLAVSVEAGLGFDAAISKLTEHMEGPLIDELGLALGEMRVGESRQVALRRLSERVDSPELSNFVRAIIQADQLGISLGKILRIQAVESRLKRQAKAEEKAMKAPIKMLFPTVAFIFPAMFIVILGPAFINLGKLFGF